MKWVRSWPVGPLPPHRAHVVDDLPRVYIENYDYTSLGALDDDICLIEWDMALALNEAKVFEKYVTRLGSPVVAPYKLYHVDVQPQWAHRVCENTLAGEAVTRWLFDGEEWCDYFGFGLVYLPRDLIRAFLAAPAPARGALPGYEASYADSRFHDQTFSVWYHHRYAGGGNRTRVLWSVRPVHLHS